MKWLSYLREIEGQRDFWQLRAQELEARLEEVRRSSDERLAEVRSECDAKVDAARARELELFDKALKRHGSTPVVRQEPPEVPPPVPSAEELAYAQDWIAEYLEVFPQSSLHEAGEYYKAWREGRYDPKLDQRLPQNFTLDGRTSSHSE